MALGNALETIASLEYRSGLQFADESALDLLPGRLRLGTGGSTNAPIHLCGRASSCRSQSLKRLRRAGAKQHFDEPEVGEVPVQAGRRSLARFLDRMEREFEGYPPGLANALADPLRKHQVMTVARAEIAAGLGDAYDRATRPKLLETDAEVQVPLEVERSQVDIRGIVEPGSGTQRPWGALANRLSLFCSCSRKRCAHSADAATGRSSTILSPKPASATGVWW